MRTLEERLLETKGQLAQAVTQNEKLTYTLREARAHRRPARGGRQAHPAAVGLRHRRSATTTTAPSTSSPAAARCGVAVHPDVDVDELDRGAEVVLNESLNVVLARGAETHRRGRHLQGASSTASAR